MSTITQHTPGPWSAYLPNQQRPLTAKGNPSDKRIMVLHPDQQRLIACMDTGYISGKGPIPKEERQANARLIAAAPELLEALRRLSFAASCRENTMGDPCRLIGVKAELDAANHQAIAAIRKATTPTA